MQLPEDAVEAGAPPHRPAYVPTPDTKATVARATELGAAVLVQPTEIPGAGEFAVLQDPQGAVFAVYAGSEESPGRQAASTVGEFSWHELATTDHEAAFGFYHQLFGWDRTESVDMGKGRMYQMYGARGCEVSAGGMFDKPAEMPGSSGLRTSFDSAGRVMK